VAAVTSLKSGSMVRLTPTTTPPAVAATWGFAKDITIEVTKGSALKIGGRVGAEEPVYPVTLSVKPPHPDMQYDGTWNAILPSPEKTELGFVGHFFCMEWCNDLVIARLPFGKLASLVFNDTGFRHHQKKDYQVSRELFLKATWANPTAPLPPYHLACAYALTNDATNAGSRLQGRGHRQVVRRAHQVTPRAPRIASATARVSRGARAAHRRAEPHVRGAGASATKPLATPLCAASCPP
jgi:hypothetical protein